MWRSHPSLIRAHNLQILGIEQGSKPRIDRSFLLSSSSLQSQAEDTNTLSSSRSSPHHGRFFGPLDPTLLVSRPYDAGMPLCHLLPRLRSCRWHVTGWHCRAPCCLHQIPGWLNDRCSPAAAIKGKPFTQNRRYESLIFVPARHHHCSSTSSN
jgi:hypothetical protein